MPTKLMQEARTEVLIIGGGVVGTAIARSLSKYKLNVALVEKEADVGFGTSKANSGAIHASFHDQPGTFKAKLCVAGNAMYDQVCEELDVPFKRCGGLLIALEDQKLLSILPQSASSLPMNSLWLWQKMPSKVEEMKTKADETAIKRRI